jgi:thymidylate kinase
VLRLLRRVPPFRRVAQHAEAGGSLLAGPEAGTSGSARTLLGHGWTMMLALANAFAQRRRVLRHTGRSRIVLFDRYTLDSVVILRHLWGSERRFPTWLIRTLSPRPLCSFLLDVRAETALERKRDQWNLENLQGLAELYRAEAPHLGVRRLDGERPREELTAEILAEIKERLT